MKIYMTPEFLNDLRDCEDKKFVRHVINHTISQDGRFKADLDDHRYKGIENAWIRYVSKGKTAYRVIYLRIDGSVYLHRAGLHAVEDRVSDVKCIENAVPIVSVHTTIRSGYTQDTGKLYKTVEPDFLYKFIESFFHVGHNRIALVAPFVSAKVLNSFHPFGRFLDRAIEDDAIVDLVTRPPDRPLFDVYRRLEERGISVYFNERLHAKLYLFDIDPSKVSSYMKGFTSAILVGSANLTEAGVGFNSALTNDELCYRVPDSHYCELSDYVSKLIRRSIDFQEYLIRNKRR